MRTCVFKSVTVRRIYQIVIVIIFYVTQSESAKILAVFPIPSISHQVVFRPLTQELVRRGHEVTVITTDPAFPIGEAPANLTEIDVHDISYAFWRKNYKISKRGWKHDPIYHMKHAHEFFAEVFEVQLQNIEVKRVIQEESFDMVFVEAGSRPAYVLSHIFKAPMILISSAGASSGIYDMVGAPTHPILYPMIVRQRIYNLTMYEKARELYHNFWFMRNYYSVDAKIDDMLKRHFGPDVPSINELRENVDMLFLNLHPILEGNYPVPPNVIHIWGVHQKPEKELPKDLKSFLDNSKNGVIYMSFGTNVHPSMLSKEKVKMLIKVLSQLPYEVLWKWNEDESNKLPSNIKTSNWFPQPDLLNHQHLKLFITQGGLQSTDEAITAGVPLIGIPIAADQWYNTEKYVYHKIGTQLDLETLTEEQFKNAIISVIEDNSYRRNIARLRSLLRDNPQSGLDRAVWWTEYVLRHGGARHLRAPAANISWAQYLELELVALVLAIIVTVLLLFTSAVYCLCKSLSKLSLKSKLE